MKTEMQKCKMSQDHRARGKGVKIGPGLSDSEDLALSTNPQLPAEWRRASEAEAALPTSHNQASFLPRHCTGPFKEGHFRSSRLSVWDVVQENPEAILMVFPR